MKDEKLLSEKQVNTLNKILKNISNREKDLYYLPTIEVCRIMKEDIEAKNGIVEDEFQSVKDLSVQDIQIFFSYNSVGKLQVL